MDKRSRAGCQNKIGHVDRTVVDFANSRNSEVRKTHYFGRNIDRTNYY